ncbi:DUF4293 family protein [Faecalibacter rhinopitheci]|uniref:DUF4293 family protein n=1 Tax=Faecalibacter rhinopitheci TaxID=2779678 RepID=A0A8J7G6P7_9FLAO|nr:DUF4293 family protein [Faecalibacter rhinopitheci]MBF0596660.1 DUF4293 family protein [Faecalibacter rhinopitheci]MBQ0148220.1 DUF4293 family protein [Candidatus Onthonaster equi]
MIQRKQSIYLFLAGLISMLMAINFDKLFNFTLNFLSDPEKGNIIFSIAFFFSAFLSFIAILIFKNRKFQMLLGGLNIILNILLIGSFLFSLLNLPGENISEKGIWALVPLISIVLLSIANRLIKKDDDLVKSVDRFR